MKRSRSVRPLFLVAAALCLEEAACGREAPPDDTSVTSGTAPSTDENAGTTTPGNETPASPTSSAPAPAAKRSAKNPSIAQRARASSKTALDKTIAEGVAQSDRDDKDVTPAGTASPQQVGQTTTTGATLSRAEPAPRAPARIAFESMLPVEYRLQRVRMMVDGVLGYDAPSAGSLRLTAGNHVVEVIADYRLDDPLFTYVRDYAFELRSTQVVPASDKSVAFVATATPRGGATTPFDRRGAIAWRSSPDQETP